jgi:uncharacterized protein (UPF0254 family)
MELNLSTISEAGCFTGAPVEKEIKWKQDGKELTATTYVRKLSYRSAVSDAIGFGGDIAAGRISACICDKNGDPVFTVEDITGNVTISKNDSPEEKERKKAIKERGPISHDLTVSLLNAIAEVNFPIKKKKK